MGPLQRLLISHAVALIIGVVIGWVIKPAPVIIDAKLPAQVKPLKPIIVTVEDSTKIVALSHKRDQLENTLRSVYIQMSESAATRKRLTKLIDSLSLLADSLRIEKVERTDNYEIATEVQMKDTTLHRKIRAKVISRWYGQPINALDASTLTIEPFEVDAQYRSVVERSSSMPWLWLSGGGAYSGRTGGPSAFAGISGFQAGAIWMPDREPTYVAMLKFWGFPN